jgi:hypothetical protein
MAQRTVKDGDDVYVVVSKHLTGIPGDLVEGIRSIHRHRQASGKKRCRIGEIYTEALSWMMDDCQRRGCGVTIEAQVSGRGGVGVTFYGRKEVISRFEELCKDLSRRESAVFVTALRGYIAAQGCMA